MKLHALAALLLAGLAAFPGQAYTPGVSLDCSGQNYCTVSISGLSYTGISWSIDSGYTDAIYPINCTNLDYCIFRCMNQPGYVQATVYVWNGQTLVGYDSKPALCSEM
ncbi:MAG TPA: hypothetical protein VGE64_05025 [Xanthomonadaceae bacterium]|jgi:hypothetical protein